MARVSFRLRASARRRNALRQPSQGTLASAPRHGKIERSAHQRTRQGQRFVFESLQWTCRFQTGNLFPGDAGAQARFLLTHLQNGMTALLKPASGGAAPTARLQPAAHEAFNPQPVTLNS
jgi:hypothetical protein